jgi:hypothetical protein
MHYDWGSLAAGYVALYKGLSILLRVTLRLAGMH